MSRGVLSIIAGDPGIGKTSTIAHAPGPIEFISINETGYDDLDDIGEIPKGVNNTNVDTYEYFLSTLEELSSDDDVRTIVIDHLGSLQAAMGKKVLYEQYSGDIKKFNAFSNGDRLSIPQLWDDVIHLLRKAQKTKHVYLLAHTEDTRKEDALEDGEILKKEICCGKWLREKVTESFPNVLILSMKKQEEGDDVRMMYTSLSCKHGAKNRLGLPKWGINLGDSAKVAWENFSEKLPEKHRK